MFSFQHSPAAFPSSSATHRAAPVRRLTLGMAIVLSLLALVAGAARADAQAPSPGKGSADSLTKYVGTWNGQFTSDHAPSADMRVVVEADKSGKPVVAELLLSMNGTMTKVPTSATAATSEDMTWQANMMGQACSGTAIVKEGALHGTLICGHGSINFALKR